VSAASGLVNDTKAIPLNGRGTKTSTISPNFLK